MRISIIIMAIFLSACGSKPQKPVHEYTQRVYLTEHDVSKDYTTEWRDTERAGSALREEGYRHVLAKNQYEDLTDNAPTGNVESYTFLTNPEEALVNTNGFQTRSYSIYEMKRWQRFCGAGKMNSKDWDFIARVGRENVPEELSVDCVSKSYTRQDYLRAWTSDCDSKEPSRADLIIRNQSIMPKLRCAL